MEDLHLTTWEEATLEYSSSFKEYIANHPLQEQVAGLSEQELANNFNGFILGVDGETLEAYRIRSENQSTGKLLNAEKLH